MTHHATQRTGSHIIIAWHMPFTHVSPFAQSWSVQQPIAQTQLLPFFM